MDSVLSTRERDNLIAGPYPIVRGAVTIAQSQTLSRGAVLGIVTASGQAILLDIAAVDGSEAFHAILLEAVTTGVGETQVAPVALSGEFASDQLSLGGATTIADILADAREKNCYIHLTDSDENIG